MGTVTGIGLGANILNATNLSKSWQKTPEILLVNTRCSIARCEQSKMLCCQQDRPMAKSFKSRI